MKKIMVCAFASCIVLFLCTACSPKSETTQILPIRTETETFDLENAKKIVGEGERLIAALSTKETVSREEFDSFLLEMNRRYGDNIRWDLMFFNNMEFEDARNQKLHVNRSMFYPTIFHEGIEIVSAEVETQYFDEENSSMNCQWLRIREEYTGPDEKLQGWNRTYTYRKWLQYPDWDWLFSSFDGEVNLGDPDMGAGYLPLKDGA